MITTAHQIHFVRKYRRYLSWFQIFIVRIIIIQSFKLCSRIKKKDKFYIHKNSPLCSMSWILCREFVKPETVILIGLFELYHLPVYDRYRWYSLLTAIHLLAEMFNWLNIDIQISLSILAVYSNGSELYIKSSNEQPNSFDIVFRCWVWSRKKNKLAKTRKSF